MKKQLIENLKETPRLELRFFSYGIVLRKQTRQGVSEYPVSAGDIAAALTDRLAINTGILGPNTIAVVGDGVHRSVIEHRPAAKTLVWLEGSSEPLHLPLPDLLLVRTTRAGMQPSYRVFASQGRPTDENAKLYQTPCPNVYGDGRICWGSVPVRRKSKIESNDLAFGWQQFLGSPFGNHSTMGKSKRFPEDIRDLWLTLVNTQADAYPLADLVESKRTLGWLLKGLTA